MRRLRMVMVLLSGICCSGLGLSAGEEIVITPQAAPYVPTDENQLLTLGKPKGDRFKLTEITWPEKPGEAEVCLWKDDKYAAASVTIDDNCAMDHPWWLEQAAKNDIKLTWFVIAGRVTVKGDPMWGGWSGFQKLLDAGHAVQSHGVNHLNHADKASEETNRNEYGGSQKLLEDNLPGNRCLTIGPPYGNASELTFQYFIAARGPGAIVNKAQATNYYVVSRAATSEGFINVILTGSTGEGIGPKWLNLNDKSNLRGWIVPVYHFVKDKKTEETNLALLGKHRDQLWLGTFPDVAMYGQERDSATLKTVSHDQAKIELSLTDRMYDKIFIYPLTLKVRLPDGWQTVKGKQDGKDVEAKFVSHEGKPYALIQAVPDQGRIIVSAN